LNQKNTKMANPTLITGFEDVLTYIRQQDERIKRLEEQEKKLREITCCAESEKLEDRISEIVESKNKYFSEVENHEETIDKLHKEGDERDNEWREIFDPSWRNLEPEDGKQYYEELKEENEKLKDQLNFIFPSTEEQNVIAKYQVDRTNRLREIEKLKKEIKEYEFESCESVVTTQKVYGQAFAIQAERDKLQKEVDEDLKPTIEDMEKGMDDIARAAGVPEEDKNFGHFQLTINAIEQLKEDIQQYKDTLEEHFVHYDNLKEEKKQDEEKISQLVKVTDQLAEKFLKHYKETDTDIMFIGRKTGYVLGNMVDHLMEGYKKLENEAKAWNIINHGADWQNIRDLCDEDMREALIKTGECDKEDFE